MAVDTPKPPVGNISSDDDIQPGGVEDPEKAVPTQDATDEESGTASPQSAPHKELQRWNESKVNIFRFFATLFSFTLIGMTDAVVGVRCPPFPLRKYLS
jgi:hypothetical protein